MIISYRWENKRRYNHKIRKHGQTVGAKKFNEKEKSERETENDRERVCVREKERDRERTIIFMVLKHLNLSLDSYLTGVSTDLVSPRRHP